MSHVVGQGSSGSGNAISGESGARLELAVMQERSNYGLQAVECGAAPSEGQRFRSLAKTEVGGNAIVEDT